MNLLWEAAQLPLFTSWRKNAAGEVAFDLVYCTATDVLIAASAFVLALVLAGKGRRAAFPVVAARSPRGVCETFSLAPA
jgi:hypothetical protein